PPVTVEKTPRSRALGKIVDTGCVFAYPSPTFMTADVVPPELLEIPSPQERRRLDRDLCAGLLDRLLRRLARQEALCRRVLGHLARHFLAKRATSVSASSASTTSRASASASRGASCRSSPTWRSGSRRSRRSP